jgi:hypothetical protein
MVILAWIVYYHADYDNNDGQSVATIGKATRILVKEKKPVIMFAYHCTLLF